MKITNKTYLPAPIYSAVCEINSKYQKGDADYSITQLDKPPRVVALENKYRDHLEVDASDLLFSIQGTAIHEILSHANAQGVFEQRMFMDIAGKRISGQPDVYCDGVLDDYKVASVYQYKNNTPPEGHKMQLNGYAMLFRENGMPVSEARLIPIFRDWSKRKAKYERGYPRFQCAVYPVQLLDDLHIRQYFTDRIVFHEGARQILPECSPEERWSHGEAWAVYTAKVWDKVQAGEYKEKKPRAKSVFRITEHEDAESRAQDMAGGMGGVVEYRAGSSIRCESYCPVSRFCEQYKAMKGNDSGEEKV